MKDYRSAAGYDSNNDWSMGTVRGGGGHRASMEKAKRSSPLSSKKKQWEWN